MDINPLAMSAGLGGKTSNVDIPSSQVQSKAGREAAAPKGATAASSGDKLIKEMMQAIEDQLRSMNISLDFAPYGKNNEKMAVIVKNETTGEVIREIPSKELQELYMSMNELIGVLYNKRI